MSGSINDIVEEIAANVYQDGVFVLRNGRHRHIEPQQVANRWSELISNERARGNIRHDERHEDRLFAWVRDHQVTFVHMDLGEPPSGRGRRGDWMPINEILSWLSTDQPSQRRPTTPA